MKRITLALLTSLLAPLPALAEDAPKMNPVQAEMMKAMEKAAAVGPEHKRLAAMAGKWKYKSKWWESGDAKPHESGGTSTMKMILGGRYLQHETSGNAMGMKFQGLGLLGFDNVKGEYQSVWLDNMGTGIMQATGSFDESTQTLKESGEFTCPVTKRPSKTRAYRGEWKFEGKNKMTFSMYSTGMLDDGPEFKNMEMVFTR